MKNRTILLTTVGAILFSASVCAMTPQSAISAAEAAQKQAASVGYEWRDTGKMIKDARKLSTEGKSAQAIKLAQQAEEQGKDAYAQYQRETRRYVKMH
jgi:hypothetical protein